MYVHKYMNTHIYISIYAYVCIHANARIHGRHTYTAVCGSVLQCFAEFCSVLQCVAVCCSVLQCVAVCCSALQYTHTFKYVHTNIHINTCLYTCKYIHISRWVKYVAHLKRHPPKLISTQIPELNSKPQIKRVQTLNPPIDVLNKGSKE